MIGRANRLMGGKRRLRILRQFDGRRGRYPLDMHVAQIDSQRLRLHETARRMRTRARRSMFAARLVGIILLMSGAVVILVRRCRADVAGRVVPAREMNAAAQQRMNGEDHDRHDLINALHGQSADRSPQRKQGILRERIKGSERCSKSFRLLYRFSEGGPDRKQLFELRWLHLPSFLGVRH